MNNLEEKCLRFVLHYYQKNKMNTQKALEAFKNKHQIVKHNNKAVYIRWLVSGAIAAMLIGFLIYPQFQQNEQWKTIAAKMASVSCTLPDGSSVTLYPNSYIQFRENKEWLSHREIRMRGKVRFPSGTMQSVRLRSRGHWPGSRYWGRHLPLTKAGKIRPL